MNSNRPALVALLFLLSGCLNAGSNETPPTQEMDATRPDRVVLVHPSQEGAAGGTLQFAGGPTRFGPAFVFDDPEGGQIKGVALHNTTKTEVSVPMPPGTSSLKGTAFQDQVIFSFRADGPSWWLGSYDGETIHLVNATAALPPATLIVGWPEVAASDQAVFAAIDTTNASGSSPIVIVDAQQWLTTGTGPVIQHSRIYPGAGVGLGAYETQVRLLYLNDVDTIFYVEGRIEETPWIPEVAKAPSIEEGEFFITALLATPEGDHYAIVESLPVAPGVLITPRDYLHQISPVGAWDWTTVDITTTIGTGIHESFGWDEGRWLIPSGREVVAVSPDGSAETLLEHQGCRLHGAWAMDGQWWSIVDARHLADAMVRPLHPGDPRLCPE